MFERFTDRARRVVVLAQEEARKLQHDHIGCGHLVLAFFDLKDEDFIAIPTVVLEEYSYTRESIWLMTGPRGNQPSAGHIPFTDEAKKVLERGLREALQLGHNYIATEHIFLGMLRVAKDDPNSECARIFGVDVHQLRQLTIVKIIAKSAEDTRDLPERPDIPVRIPIPINDYEAMHQITRVLDQLPRDRRKAVMAYLREYAEIIPD